MIYLMMLLMASAMVVAAVVSLRMYFKTRKVSEMNEDQLVSAIIRRKISILEVPKMKRPMVYQTLNAIQLELD